MTGLPPEDVLIDDYIDKVFSNKSNEYINKLEKKFRKRKIENLKNNYNM